MRFVQYGLILAAYAALSPMRGQQPSASHFAMFDAVYGLGDEDVSAINDSGVTVGFACPLDQLCYAFIRAADGTIKDFRVSGGSTLAVAINSAGVIVGDSTGTIASTAFVRDAGGNVTTFGVPGAGPGGTGVGSINASGVVTGAYSDADNSSHGYVRAADGTITTFDAPGGGTGAYQGTDPYRINGRGAIAGSEIDANNVSHGFLRAPGGTITIFDIPGAGTSSGQGTIPQDLGDSGVIVGVYLDASNVYHGFIRAADGTITTFDAQGAGTGVGEGTRLTGLNSKGAILGAYTDADKKWHSFVLHPDGSMTSIAAPFTIGGTAASAINDLGQVAGITYTRATLGFVWTP